MDVLNTIIQNSTLNGMPKWYKATTLSIFMTIVSTLLVMLIVLIAYGSQMTIRFGY
ncbi:hypothetical protein [Costertonia aggregata]|uniref:ABC transporter permease n=1 Tax=Costertonia aggregata TaxID=343403 RepID=A0A7H9AU06_9FLAO|nr:hypothetical protein [Costertonia aggregata]QLG46906.1 hypothetical protein HYG79_16615 [Costertonia aggregata]